MACQQPQKSSFIQSSDQNQGIDSLVTNALEITHSYKRQNSIMLNASNLNAAPKRPGLRGGEYILTQLSELLQSTDALFGTNRNNRQLRRTNSNASSVSVQSKKSKQGAASPGSIGSSKPPTLPRAHFSEPQKMSRAEEELSGIDGSEYSDDDDGEEEEEEG